MKERKNMTSRAEEDRKSFILVAVDILYQSMNHGWDSGENEVSIHATGRGTHALFPSAEEI